MTCIARTTYEIIFVFRISVLTLNAIVKMVIDMVFFNFLLRNYRVYACKVIKSCWGYMINEIFLIWLRRFVMIVVPLILVFVEWHHPSGFSMNVYQGLFHISHKWKFLHLYQSFLFGAVAVGALMLTFRINNLWSVLSKIFIWLFAVSYLVFDSTAGVAVGAILEMSQKNQNLDINTIKQIVQQLYNDPIIGGSGSFYSLLGSWAWLLGIVTAMIALFIDNREMSYWKLLPPILLLGISAYTLYVGHYSPYGPIAFMSFGLASLWFEFFHFGPAKLYRT